MTEFPVQGLLALSATQEKTESAPPRPGKWMLSPCYCTALNTNSSTAFSIWDLELFVYFRIWGIFCCFGALFFCSSNIFYMCTHMGSSTYYLRIVTLSPFTIESQNHLGVKRLLRSLNPAVNIFEWHPAELLLWAEWAIEKEREQTSSTLST